MTQLSHNLSQCPIEKSSRVVTQFGLEHPFLLEHVVIRKPLVTQFALGHLVSLEHAGMLEVSSHKNRGYMQSKTKSTLLILLPNTSVHSSCFYSSYFHPSVQVWFSLAATMPVTRRSKSKTSSLLSATKASSNRSRPPLMGDGALVDGRSPRPPLANVAKGMSPTPASSELPIGNNGSPITTGDPLAPSAANAATVVPASVASLSPSYGNLNSSSVKPASIELGPSPSPAVAKSAIEAVNASMGIGATSKSPVNAKSSFIAEVASKPHSSDANTSIATDVLAPGEAKSSLVARVAFDFAKFPRTDNDSNLASVGADAEEASDSAAAIEVPVTTKP